VLPPLLAQFPSHLPLLFLELKLSHELAATNEERAKVADKADAILNKFIDQQALLAHFGKLIEKDDSAGLAVRKEKEEVRKTLIKVLQVKLEMSINQLKGFKSVLRGVEFQPAALKELEGTDEPSDMTYTQALAAFQSVWSELSQWIDVNSKDGKAQFATYQIFQHKLQRQYGTLLKMLNADIATAEGSAQQKLIQDKIDLLQFLSSKENGAYAHLVRYEMDTMVIR
jgi:hypothetical protein